MLDDKINKLYSAYRAGHYDRGGFEGALFKHIIEHHRSYGLFERNSGDCSDFLSWIYPRFSKSIERYVPVKGVSFGVFIHSLIRFGFKEYRAKELKRRGTERLYWNDVAINTPYYEEEWHECGKKEESGAQILPAKFSANHTAKFAANFAAKFAQKLQPNQTLMVMLKSYHAVTDDFIERAAKDLGLNKSKLKNMVEALHKERLEQDMRVNKLRDRCSTQYYRCMFIERKLKEAGRDTTEWRVFSERLSLHRKRLERMRLRLKNMRVEATNLQVAKIMGVPKGTVDSGIHAFKRKYCR